MCWYGFFFVTACGVRFARPISSGRFAPHQSPVFLLSAAASAALDRRAEINADLAYPELKIATVGRRAVGTPRDDFQRTSIVIASTRLVWCKVPVIERDASCPAVRPARAAPVLTARLAGSRLTFEFSFPVVTNSRNLYCRARRFDVWFPCRHVSTLVPAGQLGHSFLESALP